MGHEVDVSSSNYPLSCKTTSMIFNDDERSVRITSLSNCSAVCNDVSVNFVTTNKKYIRLSMTLEGLFQDDKKLHWGNHHRGTSLMPRT